MSILRIELGQQDRATLGRIERSIRALAQQLNIVIDNEEIIMDDQTHLDQDVQALGAGLDAIEAEIAALKSQPGATALDFTALDAVVQRMQADAAPPAEAAAAEVAPDAGAEAATA